MKRALLIAFLFTAVFPAFSQNSRIKELENQRKKTLSEIAATNKLLIDTRKTTKTLLDRIKLISDQINSRQQLVTILNREIEAITQEHKKTEAEIKQLEKELKAKQDSYATAIKGMIQKKQNQNKLLFVLSGRSLGESLRRMRYLKDYSEWRNQQAEDIKKSTQELTEKKLQLERSKKEKLTLLAQRRTEQSKLKEEENTHQQEMGEANKRQKELQELIKKKQKQADAVNAQIERLIAEEVARQEREAKRIAAEKAKAEGKKPPVETTPDSRTPVVSEENIQLSNNFIANKGKFPMPVTGSCRIIAGFGQHRHAQFRGVTTNSSGVDIQTQAGSDARSIFQGEVTKVIAFPGYNNCIIVRHGGYYSFYGNIQQVYVKQGQKVTTGQSLGKVYTDPDTGQSQMHFQLWKGTVKQNPEHWLKK